MCGIVGAVSARNIVPVLVEGLKRLEYRGYDSCGVAVHQGGELRRARSTSARGRAEAQVASDGVGRHRHRPHPLGHARRAGGAQRPPALFARPEQAAASAWCTTASSRTMTSCAPSCSAKGYEFTSQTDTEVIAHLVHQLYEGDLFDAVQRATCSA
jgi:glucosamine--fructose-6-phosphate aminotransferase (isomerizing)